MALNLKAIDFLDNQDWCGTCCSIFYNLVLDFEKYAEKIDFNWWTIALNIFYHHNLS